MILTAIDPGASGGVAFLTESGETHSYPMPQTPKDILSLLRDIKNTDGAVCYIEDVGKGIPGQSSKATATFARHNGHLEMALIACGYRIEKVIPAKWQKRLGLLSKKGETKTAHKNRMKARAQELYPNIKVTLKNADALLILEYAKQMER